MTVTSATSVGAVLNYNTATTGNQSGSIVIQRNGVAVANIFVNDATAGRPLELNSAVTAGIALASGGGNVGVGILPGTERLLVDGNARFTSTAVTTSTTSGALVVAGGTGMGGNLYVGGEAVFTSNNLGIQLSAGNKPMITRRNDVFTSGAYSTIGRWGTFFESNSLTMGIPNDVAGATFNVSTYLVNSTIGNTWLSVAGLNGVTTISSTVGSSGTGSGALVVAGGAGVGQNLYVGGSVTVVGAITAGSVNTAGAVHITNTTSSPAGNCGAGALIVDGGVGILENLNVCGNTSLAGTLAVTGMSTMTGKVSILSTLGATSTGTGALVVSGGVGIGGATFIGQGLAVGGSVSIGGNLVVNGTTTTVNTATLTITDNIALVNAAPGGISDSGYAMTRYQTVSDVGVGEVTDVNEPVMHTGTARTPTSTTTITLATSASSVDDYYNGAWIRIISGTGSGQIRRVLDYDGLTKTATIYSTANETASPQTPPTGMDFTTVPDATSVYNLYDGQYILTYYDEQADEYIFGATQTNPTNSPYVEVRRTIDIRANDINSDGTLRVDTITERTTNSGTTVEGVLVKDGVLTGVVSINGVAADALATIGLIDDTSARVNIPSTGANGNYLIMIRAVNSSGARAQFSVSSSGGRAGIVNRTVSTRGLNNSDIDLEYPSGGPVRMRHTIPISGASGASLQYVVRVMAV